MRNAGLRILVFSGLIVFGLRAMQSVDGEILLQQARQSLTGNHKDTAKAKALLLEIVRNAKTVADPDILIWAQIYLGYIEDRAQNRQDAIGCYQKALTVEGASSGGVELAKVGLERPLTWIRHLDATALAPQPASSKPGKAYMTNQPPRNLLPAAHLSDRQRRENFEALWSIIDTNYADFTLKSIDWAEVGNRYRARLGTLTGDSDFYLMMFQLVNELKDTHSWLNNYHVARLPGVPDMPTDLFKGRPFVIGGAKAGWEVLSVDGMTVPEKIESLRPYLHARSSERAYRREAVRSLLVGPDNSSVSVKLRSPEGQTETVTVSRQRSLTNRPLVRTVPFDLTRQRFVHFGRLPSGLGYIQIVSFSGGQKIDDEFDIALEALRNTPGLILDIRDNPGGSGHPGIVGRFLQKRTLVTIGHIKNGPGHDDLVRRESYLGPSGPWRYTRPVALLVNESTGSASDLFACELRSAGRVTTVGTTTEGNLSGTYNCAVLPCGLVVRISDAYLSDAKDRPIEVNGNAPDITVEPDIQDYLKGRDPVLERATEILITATP